MISFKLAGYLVSGDALRRQTKNRFLAGHMANIQDIGMDFLGVFFFVQPTFTPRWAMGVILYLVLYGQFPYMPSGEATAESMKQAIKLDLPPLRFEHSQAQTALSF